LPAVVAPAGSTAGGLPVGVQVVGPAHEDDTPISFCELLDDLGVSFQAPPLFG